MTDRTRDILTGSVLLIIALVWIGLVYGTIPGAMGSASSARTYPLVAGYGLAGLSALLIVGAFLRTSVSSGAKRAGAVLDGFEWRAIAATFGFLAIYILLLQYVGFVLATVVGIAAFLVLVLGKRSPVLVLGYSLGFTFTIWLVLGELLAVYLPRGELINLF